MPFPAVSGKSKLITGGKMYSNSRNVSPIPVGVAAVWNVLSSVFQKEARFYLLHF